MNLSMIVAIAENNGIGINNTLPWEHIPQDMKWFKENTAGKVVVMGSSTWDSLPRKPLPNRVNVVLSSRGAFPGSDFTLNGEPKDVLFQLAQHTQDDTEVVIMGGAKVYEAFFPYVNKIYLTRVGQRVEADTYLDVDALMEKHSDDVVKFKLQHRQTYFDPHHVTFEIWSK